MVFLHPNPLDGSSWLYQMAHFSTWYHCIAMDLPGYGRSAPVRPPVTLRDLAKACWTSLEGEIPAEPVVLVGSSVGSHLARHMYHLAPDRVSALVLSGAGWRPVKEFAFRRAEQYRERGLDFRREHAFAGFSEDFRQTPQARWLVGMMLERNNTTDLGSVIAMFDALGEPDPAWLHEDLQAPVLVVSGSEDGAHASAFALHDRLPRSQLVVLEGAGHVCQFERPWEFDAAMVRFLVALGDSPLPGDAHLSR